MHKIRLSHKQAKYLRKRVHAWRSAKYALDVARRDNDPETNKKRDRWLQLDREVTDLAAYNLKEGCYGIHIRCEK